MPTWLGLIAFVTAIAVFLWLCAGCRSEGVTPSTSSPQGPIDAADPKLIGLLIGMSGGTISDAAQAQFALRHFEASTGRKATAQDLGFIVGMMSTYDPPGDE